MGLKRDDLFLSLSIWGTLNTQCDFVWPHPALSVVPSASFWDNWSRIWGYKSTKLPLQACLQDTWVTLLDNYFSPLPSLFKLRLLLEMYWVGCQDLGCRVSRKWPQYIGNNSVLTPQTLRREQNTHKIQFNQKMSPPAVCSRAHFSH